MLHRALKNLHDLLLDARALEDLNKPFGAAKFMVTMVPSAYATTRRELCLNVKDVTSVSTLGDNAFEALHIVQVLDQSCRGLLFNTSYVGHRARSSWAIFEAENPVCKHGLTVSSFRNRRARNYQVLQPNITMGLACHTFTAWFGAQSACVTPIFFVSFVLTLHRISHSSMQLFSVCKLWTDHKPHICPLQTRTRWDGSTTVLRHNQEDEDSGTLPSLTPLCLSGLCHSNVYYIANAGRVAE